MPILTTILQSFRPKPETTACEVTSAQAVSLLETTKATLAAKEMELVAMNETIAARDAEILSLNAEKQSLQERLDTTRNQLELAIQQLERLKNAIHGHKTEQTPAGWEEQLLLTDDSQAATAAQPAEEKPTEDKPAEEKPGEDKPTDEKPKSAKPKGGSKPGRTVRGARLPASLPVRVFEMEPEEVKANPEQWEVIGEDVTEKLEITPREAFLQRFIRKKYKKKDDPQQPPVTAPLPPEQDVVQAGSIGPQLLIEFTLGKYLYHLPLYRQARALEWEFDIKLPESTLCDNIGAVAQALEPIYKEMQKSLWAQSYVQIDLTPVRCLSSLHEGGSFLGQMWVAGIPHGDIIFHWDKSKEAAVADRIIPVTFRGHLQCDGGSEFECYLNGGKARVQPPPKDRITRLGCWAHVRRKFHEAAKKGCRRAAKLLRLINILYRIEGRAAEWHLDASARQKLREKRSTRVLRRIRRLADEHLADKALRRTSLLIQSVKYLDGQWPDLEEYVKHGHVEIDNNWIENGIRPLAVGKKNFLFIGAVSAGQRSAVLYSIIGSCLRREINPRAYLTWVFARLRDATNKTVWKLTPAGYEAWLKEQKPAIPQPVEASPTSETDLQAAA